LAKYNHRKAARLAAKVKKLKEASGAIQPETKAIKRTSVAPQQSISKADGSAKAKPIVKSVPYKTKAAARRAINARNRKANQSSNLGKIIIIASAIIVFLGAIFIVGRHLFNFDFSSTTVVSEDDQAVVSNQKNVLPMTTEFTREQVTANLMLNSSGNFITIENDADYNFKDIVFRETDIDGNILKKKVISSDYTLYTYSTRHCNDIIELNDGYLLVGYNQRGDYALGNSDRNIWYAKIDFDANIIWEHITDDGYLQSEILTVEPYGDGAFRLYIRSEALKRWFKIIDASGDTVSAYDMNEDFVDYVDTNDGGKAFIKKRTSDISILKKVDADGNMTLEEYVVGDYNDIYEVDGGFILFGQNYINDEMTSVAVMVDANADVVWQKEVSRIGHPTVNDVFYAADDGYILAGYIFETEGNDGPRTVSSLFDDSLQELEDAWVVKLDEACNIVWEQTYAYGDMGALFDGIIKLSDQNYYLSGEAQYQGDDAADIVKDRIVTKIVDGETTEGQRFVQMDTQELTESPVIDYVGASEMNNNIMDGAAINDYALKVFWQSVEGATSYEVEILDGSTSVMKAETKNKNSFVFENIISSYNMVELANYSCTVTAITDENSSIKSDKFSFTFYNNEYYAIRSWFPEFDQENSRSEFYYRLGNGASTVEVFRHKVADDGHSESNKLVSTDHSETIQEDFRSIGYGTYYYEMVLVRDNGVILTKDTPQFTFADSDLTDLSYIQLDEEALINDLGFSEDDIKALRELIHLGQFDDDNRKQVKVLQLFCNYYLEELAKLGIYSPDTEPESGFDIPIEVSRYFGEDTRKATAYLLTYFGRSNFDGEHLVSCIDENFFADIATLNKIPLTNDIITAIRSEGVDAKYNAGYSFDTSNNFLEGVQFAIPVDHDPQKSAYFGIRYLPILNEKEYDTGVRLHAGLDFRCEIFVNDDAEYIEAHAGEEYIDTEDQVEESGDETDGEVPGAARELIRDRIYSLYDGVVVKTIESNVGNGTYVKIKHVTKDANKTVFYSQYLHLSSILCEVGQQVKRGEVIGTMGNTGYSGGKHLHLEFFTEEMRVSTFLNPLIYDYAYEPLKDEAMDMERELGIIDY